MTNRKGFTLIELMVGVAIVAVLATIGFASYGQVQMRSRDHKRKQDLRAISMALDLYYRQNRTYPSTATGCAVTGWCFSTNTTTQWIPQLTSQYISPMPSDPTSNGATPWTDNSWGYAYWAGDTTGYPAGPNGETCPGAAGRYYVLVTQLENRNDSERNGAKHYKWCNGFTLDGTGSNYYTWSLYSFVITSHNNQ